MESDKRLCSSCETFALLKTPFFISAYPSYILFGKTNANIDYDKKCVFEFSFSEAYKLLLNVFYIGSFVASDLENANGKILEKSDVEYYFWSAFLIQKNNRTEKVVKLGIEKQSEITFEIIFSLEEFNNFNYLFKRCLLSSLCLKDHEEQFILWIVQSESCETIVLAKKDFKTGQKLIKCFYEDYICEKPDKVTNLLEILSYYNDIILIIKQFHTLVVPLENNTSLILANLD